jgi:single-strand DNA-binding protein
MSSVNKVILVGHVGQDPNLRYLNDGNAVLSFPLATSDWITRDGVKVEQTEWHNIVMWRGLAEAGSKVLKKNALVYVEGKMRTRNFIDKDGIKKYTTEIHPDQFNLLGRASDFKEFEKTDHL